MFIEKMIEQTGCNTIKTENGAIGYKTTGKALLDMNFKISSYRSLSEDEIIKDFDKAFEESPELALRFLFYVRDVRGGIGERRLFRVIMRHLINNMPETALALAKIAPEYGRWDDVIDIVDTYIGDRVISQIIEPQIFEDLRNMINNDSVSLLAKWMSSENASSKLSRKRAIKIAKQMGLSMRSYGNMLSTLRGYIDVVEVKMSANKWNKVDYEKVPSQANLLYKNAFLRQDEVRRREYLAALEKGEVKINSSTVFPHEITYKYNIDFRRAKDQALEAMWKALPDYVNGDSNTLVVRDGSGSMTWTAIAKTEVKPSHIADALTIYFANRASGEFKNAFITFSSSPQIVKISGKSLFEDLNTLSKYDECSNTNIKAVFELILKTAKENKMKQEDLPKNILVLSDMEFDSGARNIPLMSEIAQLYAENGYELPKLCYWNICSRSNAIPVKENKNGIVLVSGFSPAVIKMVLSSKIDPYEALVETLRSERYDLVSQSLKKFWIHDNNLLTNDK